MGELARLLSLPGDARPARRVNVDVWLVSAAVLCSREELVKVVGEVRGYRVYSRVGATEPL